jgi:hypothetical protein
MTSSQRLQHYLERQLELLAGYGELQGKIEESIRAGAADALAVQAGGVRALTAQLAELERAAQTLASGAAAGSPGLRALRERLAAAREQVLQANRANRVLLGGAMEQLRGQLRELGARPRIPPSPVTRIGQPVLVDLQS